MPGAAIAVLVPVRVRPRVRGGRSADRRTRRLGRRRSVRGDGGMEPPVDGEHEAGGFGGDQRVGSDSERGPAPISPRDCRCRRLPRARAGCELSSGRSRTRSRNAQLDAAAQDEPLGQRLPSRQLRLGQLGGKLDKCEWVARRRLEEPLSNLGGRGPRSCEKRPCRLAVEAADVEVGSPGPAKIASVPSRAAKSITTRSAWRRRLANTSASAEGSSSHWASSTRQSSGPSSATSARRLSTPK